MLYSLLFIDYTKQYKRSNHHLVLVLWHFKDNPNPCKEEGNMSMVWKVLIAVYCEVLHRSNILVKFKIQEWFINMNIVIIDLLKNFYIFF